MNVAPPVSANTFVIAAVSDVFPCSTCPIVPTLQCGFVRSNFAFAMIPSPSSILSCHLGANFVGHGLGYLFVVVEMHRVLGAALAHGPQRADIAEHVG